MATNQHGNDDPMAALTTATRLMGDRQWTEAGSVLDELLDHHPGFIGAILRRSELRQIEDRYRESRKDSLRAAEIALQNRKWAALGHVTTRLMAFGERIAARYLILQADWGAPGFLQNSAVLSQQLWLAEDYPAALQLLDKADAAYGANPLLMYSRANAYMYSGNDHSATRQYRHIIEMFPSFPHAYWSLAFYAPSSLQADDARKMATLIAALPPSHAETRAALHYALYRWHEQNGRYDKAWQELEQGAALKHGLDGSNERDFMEIIRRWMEKPASAATVWPAHGPIFIVGLPRTGTTLLDKLLCERYEARSIGESGLMGQALAEAFDTFHVSPLAPSLGSVGYQEAGAGYLEKAGKIAESVRYVDKTLDNLWNAVAILQAIPGARMLCLSKSPMDAGFSLYRAYFPAKAYSYSYDQGEVAARYIVFDDFARYLEDQFPSAFLRVDYGRLVKNTDQMLDEVAQFCGLIKRNESDIGSSTLSYLSASSSQVRQGVTSAYIAGWKKYQGKLSPMADAFLQADKLVQ